MKKINLLLSVLFVSFMIGCKSIDELEVKPKDGLVKLTKPFVLDTNSIHLKPNSMETLKQLEAMFQKNMKNNKATRKADFDNYAFGKSLWEEMLTQEQNQWFNNIALFGNNSEEVKEKIWNDIYEVENFMRLIGMELNRNIFDPNSEISSPYFSLKLALLSAAHVQSIGDGLTGGWVAESYKNRFDNDTRNQILYNDYVGRSIGHNTQNNGFYLFLDVTMTSWVNNNRAIPGSVLYGYYEGVPIFVNVFMQSGRAVTFPGYSRSLSGIHFATDEINLNDTRRHEFGHILQSEETGLLCFYTTIAIASIKSADRQGSESGYSHNCFWTEVTANWLSWKYFNYPTDWNENSFPTYANTQCDGYKEVAIGDMCKQ
jgi:hypothetical protein